MSSGAVNLYLDATVAFSPGNYKNSIFLNGWHAGVLCPSPLFAIEII